MALRRQNLSPTANLLRNSRLFSLPNPLPRPIVAQPNGAGSVKASDTATLPYPTHQAIATTPSSLARGDWGFKRPLPKRSRLLQTSNPVVRIEQWDTIEQITDFDSAADHVRTRQKFEELSTPLMKGMSQLSLTDVTAPAPKSVFEPAADTTAYETEHGLDGAGMYLQALKEKVKQSVKNSRSASEDAVQTYTPPAFPEHAARLPNQRWKHDGPWLPGMSAVEYTAYLSKELASRRAEFNDYLVEYVKGQIYAARSSYAKQNEEIPLDPTEAEAYRAKKEQAWANISPSDIEAGIRDLRAQCANDPLSSKLVQNLIIPFLRLPPIKVKATQYSVDASREVDNQKFTDETTPSSTHPSAGLGYLRTRAYLANHPILGPQSLPTPITARVIQPRQAASNQYPHARLGVAGFVADDQYRTLRAGSRQTGEAGIDSLDTETVGGAKVHVQPRFAAVSPDGKVHIKVARSHGAELKVKKGQLDDAPPARENVEANPLGNLNLGKSGVPELDAQSNQEMDKSMAQFFDLLGEQKGGNKTGTPIRKTISANPKRAKKVDSVPPK